MANVRRFADLVWSVYTVYVENVLRDYSALNRRNLLMPRAISFHNNGAKVERRTRAQILNRMRARTVIMAYNVVYA